MRRRELLKGLAAFPFTAAAIAGCDEKQDRDDKPDSKEREKHAGIVEVHLEGAFALVIQKNKGNSLLAFSPRPAPKDEQHKFYFNGYDKPESTGKGLTFKLSPEGLERKSEPIEINPGLNDFLFETENWRVGDSLVTIELPAPDKITFSGHRTLVHFQDGRPGWLPSNRVLKYELHGAGAAKLQCSDGNLKCGPSADAYPGVTRFFFEIGPARTLDRAKAHLHAINFFNYMLQQSFPDLAKKYSLIPDRVAGTAHAEMAPHVVAASLRFDSGSASQRPVSYLVDCELGGVTVGTKTPSHP